MTSSSPPKVFRCGCGNFKFSLSGTPVSNLNCHGHSCAAAARYIDENPGSAGKGISNIDGSAGVALACYKLVNAEFPEGKDPRVGMGSVKVGDSGKMLRYFSTCCGTPVLVSEAKFSVLMVNRNALYVDDECKTKYIPDKPALNIMTKYCFGEKANIASPKSDIISFGALLSFIPLMISSAIGFGYGPNKFPARNEDVDRAEVCPITWE